MAAQLARAGVPQTVFFYVVLGAISGMRKVMLKAAQAGCPPNEMVCFDFTTIAAGTEFDSPFEQEGFVFSSVDQSALRAVGWGVPVGRSKLAVPAKGLDILLPYPVEWATVRGAHYALQPLTLQGAHDETLRDSVTGPPENNVLHELTVRGESINRLVVTGGGGEALLFDVCIPAPGGEVHAAD
jgi:hypothetical protein